MARPKAIGYARISRLAGRTRGENNSIEEQRRVIAEICAAHGFDLKLMIEEEDVSGATFDRPGWKRAVSMIVAKDADVIVSYDLDRISRAPAPVTWYAVSEVEEAGGQVFDRTGQISVTDANAEILTMIRSMMNDHENRKRAERAADNVRKAIIEKRAHLSAPFGYVKPGKGARLKVEQGEAAIVREIFERRADGWSWPRIADALNAGPVKPRPYKRHGQIRQAGWKPAHLRTMVSNEVYLGTAFNGKALRVPGAHPAIVSPQLFAKANRVQGRKFSGPSEGYLLSGLVRCASCGYVMAHTRGSARDGAPRYYQCQQRTCKSRVSVPAVQLEDLAREQFASLVAELPEYEAVADDVALIEAEAALAQAEGHLARMLDRFGSLDLDQSEQQIIEGQIEAARKARRDAADRVERERHAANGIDLPTSLTVDSFDAEPVEQRRHLLALVFGCFVARKAATWREDVGQRVRVFRRDQAPTNSTALIPFVAALDW